MFSKFKMSALEDVFDVRDGESDKAYETRVSRVLFEYIGDRYTSRYDTLMSNAQEVILRVRPGESRNELETMYSYSMKQTTRYDNTYEKDAILSLFGTPTSRLFNLLMKMSKICSVLESDISNMTKSLVHKFTNSDVAEWLGVIANKNLYGKQFLEDIRNQVKQMRCFRLAASVVERVAAQKVGDPGYKSGVVVVVAMTNASYNMTFPPIKCAVWLKLALAYDNACSWILRILAAKEFVDLAREVASEEVANAMHLIMSVIEDEPVIKDVFRVRYFDVQQGKRAFCAEQNKMYKKMFEDFCKSKGFVIESLLGKRRRSSMEEAESGGEEEVEFEDLLEPEN